MYQRKTNVRKIAVFINEHFAMERKMVKAYVTFFIVALPFLELFMLGYAIYHLIVDIDDQNYRESEITNALTYIEVARSTTLTFWFIGALARMLKEMHYSYNWLF